MIDSTNRYTLWKWWPITIPRTHLYIVFEPRLVRTLRFFFGECKSFIDLPEPESLVFSLVSFALFAIFITCSAISPVWHTPKYIRVRTTVFFAVFGKPVFLFFVPEECLFTDTHYHAVFCCIGGTLYWRNWRQRLFRRCFTRSFIERINGFHCLKRNRLWVTARNGEK